MGDAANLDVGVVGGQLAANGGPVFVRGVVEVLLAVAPTQRLHGAHPEVVPVRSNDMDGLAEAQLDLEAVSVELNDLQRLQGEVRGEEKDGSPHRMVNEDEAHDAARRSPEQVQATVAQGHVLIPVDGTGRGRERSNLLGKLLDPDLLPVDPWAPLGPA